MTQAFDMPSEPPAQCPLVRRPAPPPLSAARAPAPTSPASERLHNMQTACMTLADSQAGGSKCPVGKVYHHKSGGLAARRSTCCSKRRTKKQTRGRLAPERALPRSVHESLCGIAHCGRINAWAHGTQTKGATMRSAS